MADKTHKQEQELALEESMAKAALFDKKDNTQTTEDGPLFQDIDGDQEVTEIESLCMNCHENVCYFPHILQLHKRSLKVAFSSR